MACLPRSLLVSARASGFFVEFGAESGREGNCVYLADVASWQGLFLDGDADSFAG